MRIISVKKLIISTLIFLFSSYHEPMLASNAPPPQPVQESVVTQAPILSLGAPQKLTLQKPIGAIQSVAMRSLVPSFTLMQELENVIIRAQAPSIDKAPYLDQKAGWVISEQFNPLQPLFTNPSEYGISSEFVSTIGYPRIFNAAGISSSLLFVPTWNETMQVAVEYTFLAFFIAFSGYYQLKGRVVHLGAPITSEICILASMAAALAPLDKLVIHTDDTVQVDQAAKFLKQNEGKTVKELIQSLSS